MTQNPFTTRRILALTMGVGLAAIANVVAVVAAFWLDGKDILTTVIGFDIAASQTIVAFYFVKRETEDDAQKSSETQTGLLDTTEDDAA